MILKKTDLPGCLLELWLREIANEEKIIILTIIWYFNIKSSLKYTGEIKAMYIIIHYKQYLQII